MSEKIHCKKKERQGAPKLFWKDFKVISLESQEQLYILRQADLFLKVGERERISSSIFYNPTREAGGTYTILERFKTHKKVI